MISVTTSARTLEGIQRLVPHRSSAVLAGWERLWIAAPGESWLDIDWKLVDSDDEKAPCDRCGHLTDPYFHAESGGLCAGCLADDGLLPLTRFNTWQAFIEATSTRPG